MSLKILILALLSTYDAQVLDVIDNYIFAGQELTCLAENIYFESRGQREEGQIAVGQVTLNRVNSHAYKDTICEVVKQPAQFSWYWDDKSDIMVEEKAKANSYRIAFGVITDSFPDVVSEATHYHNFSVTPNWSRNLELVTIIHGHIFYK